MSDDFFKYFREQTNERFDRIDQKLDTLLAFKWQIVGGSVVISTLISVLITIYGGQ